MNKCYYRIVWENYPSDKTPLNEQNLNRIDVAVDEIDNRIISLDSTKFDKSEAQLLVKYIEYDEDTGIFKITHYNGTSYTIDTLLEKLAINFDYDYQTQKLIIQLSDGEIKYVDLSVLITQYEFLESETIHFVISPDGKVAADIKEGSIQEKHLRPDYLADIKVEVANAQASQIAAAESEKNAKSSENAAKDSQEAAKLSENNAAASATNAEDSATVSGQKAADAKKYADASKASEENAQASQIAAAESEKNAKSSENAASESATNASASAHIAVTKSTEASGYADKSQSYAVGTGGAVRENDDSDCAEYYYNQTKKISQSFSGVIPMGTITFEDLSNTDNQQSGYMFNISDSFVSDERFQDGGGIFYGAGNNVLYTADGKWDVLASAMVSGVKGNAEKEYRQGFVNVTAEDIGIETATANNAGIVKPDGDTITVDEDGTIHGSVKAEVATTENAGIVKPDGKTIKVASDGTITGASLEFTGTAEEVQAAISSGGINEGTIVNIIESSVNVFKDGKLKKIADLSSVGDTKDNIVTFESGDNLNPISPTEVPLITSGETHASLFKKLSTMAKNTRYLLKMLGNKDISNVADGTITGAISELNTGLGYIDIASQISVGSSGLAIDHAYALHGICLIHIILPSGTVGTKRITVAKAYAPLSTVNGIYSAISDANDAGKVNGSRVRSSGEIEIWIGSTLSTSESVTFQYPIKQL